MPTYTTITENQDGTYSLTVHDADALRRIQTMCDIIREDDDDPEDDERNQVADYAEDLYRIIDDALTAEDRTDPPTIYTVFDYPRRNPNGGNPPWLDAIHAANAAANAAGITEPFGTPELTPMSRVPGEAHTEGTCEWYPDYRVEHRRNADYVRITTRTAEAAALMRSITH